MSEQYSNIIKHNYDALGIEMVKFEETILSKVIVEQLINDLSKLKSSIQSYKGTCRQILTEICPQMYLQKKELISMHLNYLDGPENEKIVRWF